MRILLIFLITYFLLSCNNDPDNRSSNSSTKTITTPKIDWIYINSYPHDTTSFTEGLLFYNGNIFESTGSPNVLPHTKSQLGTVDLITGKINIKAEIDRKLFGEGIAILNEKVYWLTYKAKIGFIYDLKTFKKIREFSLSTNEGWGLTTDGTNLIMSDGSDKLTFIDPERFTVVKKINVTENNYVIEKLNELEYINGFIYANIWTTNTIVKIEPENGNVVGKLDLSSFAQEVEYLFPKSLEMNGIAYDTITEHIYITGKFWPKIYKIKLEGKTTATNTGLKQAGR